MSYVDSTTHLGSATVYIPEKVDITVHKNSGHSDSIYVEIGSNLTLHVRSVEALHRLIAGLHVALGVQQRPERMHWFYTEDSADLAA